MLGEIKKPSSVLKVFVAAVDEFAVWNTLPAYAAEELNTIKNPRVSAEKRAGYGLLDKVARLLEPEFDVTKCYLGETGKPLHPKLWFSVSHSGGMVAVVVSCAPVGLDVESEDSLARVLRLEQRITLPKENYENPLALWTMKEAVFKLEGKDKIFRPSDVDTTIFQGTSFGFEFEGKRFVLSVAAEQLPRAEVCCFSQGKEISVKRLDI